MKFRGTHRFGGVTYYKLIGSIHTGPHLPQPGDAVIYSTTNASRDHDLRTLNNVNAKDSPTADFEHGDIQRWREPEHGRPWAGREGGSAPGEG